MGKKYNNMFAVVNPESGEITSKFYKRLHDAKDACYVGYEVQSFELSNGIVVHKNESLKGRQVKLLRKGITYNRENNNATGTKYLERQAGDVGIIENHYKNNMVDVVFDGGYRLHCYIIGRDLELLQLEGEK